MATKTKPKTEPVKPRNAVQVVRGSENDNPDDAVARTLTRPEVNAAATIQKLQGDNHEINALIRELSAQVAVVNGGDLKRAEGMLTSQAYTLDELFNNLARRAHGNWEGGYIPAAEIYLRLALKAQSQCRATLETLAQIRNPPVIYARQANIANGPQQVNNNVPSRTREFENRPSKLSGGGNELLPDTRASALAGRANQEVETVGAVNRAEVKSG